MSPSAAAMGAAALAAFLLSAGLSGLALRYAPALGFVAHPDAVNRHGRPVPLLGGSAILAAGAPGAGWAASSSGVWGYFLAGLMIVLCLGLLKDRGRWLPPVWLQLGGQALAAALLLAGGWSVPTGAGPVGDAAATVLFVLVAINAVNFLDVQDALAGGCVAIALTGFCLLAIVDGRPGEAIAAASLASAVGGFLLYNRPPARLFMGDAGSLGLGYAIAALALGTLGPGHQSWWPALLLLALPIAEFAVTVALRLSLRRSPLEGDGTHLSTALRARGWPAGRVLAAAHGISAAAAAAAVVLALPNG